MTPPGAAVARDQAYQEFIARVRDWAATDPRVRLVLVIGSRGARDRSRVTASADLDLVLVVNHQRRFLRDRAWLSALGSLQLVAVSQEGRAFAASAECLCLYAPDLLVDVLLVPDILLRWYIRAMLLLRFLPLGPAALHTLFGSVSSVLRQGVATVYDPAGLAPLVHRVFNVPARPRAAPSRARFERVVATFWITLLKATNKLASGQLARAHQLADEVLRPRLITVAGWHVTCTEQASEDVWYRDALVEQWGAEVLPDLAALYAPYERAATGAMLAALAARFAALSAETAALLGYSEVIAQSAAAAELALRQLDALAADA